MTKSKPQCKDCEFIKECHVYHIRKESEKKKQEEKNDKWFWFPF